MSESRSIRQDIGGMTAIVATYVYFLLYAQFGFVSQMKGYWPDPESIQKAMGAMAMAGIAASLLAGALLGRINKRNMLIVAFSGCAAAAGLSLLCKPLWSYLTVSFLIGGFTGLVTVSLAAGLRGFVGGRHFALKIGTATGIAYFVCNIPMLFESSGTTQAIFSALCCLVGAFSAFVLPRGESDITMASPLSAADFRPLGFLGIVASLLALVWLDSTAFATIQLNEVLKAQTWADSERELINGILHCGAAVITGWMIDRGYFRSLLLGTFALFAVAFSQLATGVGLLPGGPLYVVGISVYSVALVVYPSLWKNEVGLIPIRWRAAVLFGVAGWIGSALGVGMAQHLQTIPQWAVGTAGVIILVAALSARSQDTRFFLRHFALPIVLLMVAIALFREAPRLQSDSAVMRGRDVYISEGCINCHSQYIRPRTRDVEFWGPYRDVDWTEVPPMLGNRRQGPDLMNVALRRSAEWQRIHLMNPSSTSPGSKMPSYAHLFAEGDSRGDDLVQYLQTLGAGRATERMEHINEWTVSPDKEPSTDSGAALFAASCAVCHGVEGKGDGPSASLFGRPPADLTMDSYTFIPTGLSPDEETRSLNRDVKFGIMGTSMPGHETFTDDEAADVTAFVQSIRGGK